jgi:hypothetical protein
MRDGDQEDHGLKLAWKKIRRLPHQPIKSKAWVVHPSSQLSRKPNRSTFVQVSKV